jgi:hypothetical protein
MNLSQWQEANRKSRAAGMEGIPLTPTALLDINKSRIARKLDPLTLAQAQEMQAKQIPMSAHALVLGAKGTYPAEPDMCSRWVQLNLHGKSGDGNGLQLAGSLVDKYGWSDLPEGEEPKAGDVLSSAAYGTNPNGHTGFVAFDPTEKRLRLLSNYEGRVGFIDLRPGRYVRPPSMSRLDYELQYPGPLPTPPTPQEGTPTP